MGEFSSGFNFMPWSLFTPATTNCLGEGLVGPVVGWEQDRAQLRWEQGLSGKLQQGLLSAQDRVDYGILSNEHPVNLWPQEEDLKQEPNSSSIK